MAKILGPDFLALQVRNLEASRTFYTEQLGLELAPESPPHALPTHEPRLARAMTLAYGLDHLPTTQEARQIAEVWRPYRTWGSLLLRVMLEEETQEIARGRERR